MGKLLKYIVGILSIGIGTLMLFNSCDNQDEPDLVGKHRSNEDEENNESGISFDIESDEMDEDVEELYFESKEWDDEEMNVDL